MAERDPITGDYIILTDEGLTESYEQAVAEGWNAQKLSEAGLRKAYQNWEPGPEWPWLRGKR